LITVPNEGGGGGTSGSGSNAKGKSNSLDICAICINSSGSQKTGVEVNGSSSIAMSVALDWGTGSKSVDTINKNEDWDTKVILNVGEHKFTATVNAPPKTVNFTVVLPSAIRAYTAEQIQQLKTYTNKAKIRDVEQWAEDLSLEAGLTEEDDDYAGFSLRRKVNEFAAKASGDYCLFFSGNGTKEFIERRINKIFGKHLPEDKKTALIEKIFSKKTACFIDATDELHIAMKNTMDIFFADDSIGQTISNMDIPIGINPAMVLVLDAAKTVVSIKLNVQLAMNPMVRRN